MAVSSVRVPGKVNLALCVAPRRADGYHDLYTLFQAVSLHEEGTALARGDAEVPLQETGESRAACEAVRVPDTYRAATDGLAASEAAR